VRVSHRAEPVWQLAALPSPSGSSPLPSGITKILGRCHGDPTLLGPCRKPAQGARQTEEKPYQQKLLCQYRSRSKLRLGIAREQEQDHHLHWFSGFCKPTGLRDVRLRRSTCSSQHYLATSGVPACRTSVIKPCPQL